MTRARARKRKRINKQRARQQSARAKLRLKPHSLYYLQIDLPTTEPVYKIGISSNLIQRIEHLYNDYQAEAITLIFSEKFPNKWEAEDAETLVKELYQQHTGCSLILTSETFSTDILDWYHTTQHSTHPQRTYTAKDFEHSQP